MFCSCLPLVNSGSSEMSVFNNCVHFETFFFLSGFINLFMLAQPEVYQLFWRMFFADAVSSLIPTTHPFLITIAFDFQLICDWGFSRRFARRGGNTNFCTVMLQQLKGVLNGCVQYLSGKVNLFILTELKQRGSGARLPVFQSILPLPSFEITRVA